MSDEDDKPTPDWIAQLDQMNAGLRDLAKAIGTYYVALIETGFTAEQAIVLTVGFQATFVATLGQQQAE